MANRPSSRLPGGGHIVLIGTLVLVAVLLAAGIRRIAALAPQQFNPVATPTALSVTLTPATATPIAGATVQPSLPPLSVFLPPFRHLFATAGRAGSALTTGARQNAQPVSPLPAPLTAAPALLLPTVTPDWPSLPTPAVPDPASVVTGSLAISDLLALPLPAALPQPQDATVITATATPTVAPSSAGSTPAIQPTPDGVARTAHVPILMYHYLSVPPANADIYRLDLSVTPDRFAAHLDALQAAGYTTISLYDLLQNLVQGTPLPDKPVIITFDDGYRDNYENAFPLLVAHNMTATFFVVTDFIDGEYPEYVTWDMVRAMHDAGMSIEAHGRNHASLENRDNDYLVWQALGSLEGIERAIGVRPRFIAYPSGDYDQATIDLFHSANYWGGLTTVQGATHSSDDLFQLSRVRVHGDTSADDLLRLLTLDW